MKLYALLSVYDKEGLTSIARTLEQMGMSLLATGGTYKELKASGFSVTEVSELTEEPERFGGRVKTLHHKILGSILLRPGQDEKEWPFDFRIGAVVCNFYPFAEKADACESLDELMEWVDIGGPTMVRAAAKNHKHVWILTRVAQYSRFIMGQALHEEDRLRRRLALEAFDEVAKLDNLIVNKLYHRIAHAGEEKALRYGENPHQKAWFFAHPRAKLQSFGELSFNNLRDAEAAFRFVAPFTGPAVSVVKHQTLCGAAAALNYDHAQDVFFEAWEGDPVSRFGGIIAMNFMPTPAIHEVLKTKFLELLLLPKTPETEAYAQKLHAEKDKIRVMLVSPELFSRKARHEEVFVGALGELHQEADQIVHWDEAPTMGALLKNFGQWTAACSKSNAISLVGLEDAKKIAYLAGAGQGQPNRVEALKLLAIPRAQDFCKRLGRDFSKLSCFSEAFIPFRDTLDILKEAGVGRLFQPGGSKKDDELKTVAQEIGLEMVITRERHFWH
jgi:phosphoribosylaminoimidazolecarboxamide formyltransferase/IMP cyclohydrolase